MRKQGITMFKNTADYLQCLFLASGYFQSIWTCHLSALKVNIKSFVIKNQLPAVCVCPALLSSPLGFPYPYGDLTQCLALSLAVTWIGISPNCFRYLASFLCGLSARLCGALANIFEFFTLINLALTLNVHSIFLQHELALWLQNQA